MQCKRNWHLIKTDPHFNCWKYQVAAITNSRLWILSFKDIDWHNVHYVISLDRVIILGPLLIFISFLINSESIWILLQCNNFNQDCRISNELIVPVEHRPLISPNFQCKSPFTKRRGLNLQRKKILTVID